MEGLIDTKNDNVDMWSMWSQMVSKNTRKPKNMSKQKMQKSVLGDTKNKKPKKIESNKRICKRCGKEFYTFPSRLGNYCSRECTRGNPNPTITLICKRCGKTFTRTQATINKTGGKYCSRKCVHEKKCIALTCELCGKQFTRWPSTTTHQANKYCSYDCAWKAKIGTHQTLKAIQKRSGENSCLWKGGISFEPYCPKFNNNLKQRIRAFFEYRCVCCGKHEKEDKRKHCCHHVEYNKQACCDGKQVCFATMCHKHHAQSNFERDRWESMLHRIIDEVYDGKSYYTIKEWEEMNDKNIHNGKM